MLLDTSGFYALLDSSEAGHRLALDEYDNASSLLTHSYILAELVPLAKSRGIARLRALDFITSLLDSGEVEIIWCHRRLHKAAHELLLARLDKKYSLCDAVSFVLMAERRETQALTTDRHFEQEGFVRLLPP